LEEDEALKAANPRASTASFSAGIVLMLLAMGIAGCQSRVGVGDGPTFSENDTFLLEVTSFARYRYSYVDLDQTPKDFHVCLSRSGTCIFRKDYSVVGWDISWQIH